MPCAASVPKTVMFTPEPIFTTVPSSIMSRVLEAMFRSDEITYGLLLAVHSVLLVMFAGTTVAAKVAFGAIRKITITKKKIAGVRARITLYSNGQSTVARAVAVDNVQVMR